MIYYFTIYDILHHESIAHEALEYAFASIGACLCKHWSMPLPALEHDGEALEYDVTSNRARRCKH